MMDLVAKIKLEVDKSSLGIIGSVPDKSPGMDAFKKLEKTPDMIAKAQKEAMKQINSDIFKSMVKEQREIIQPTEKPGILGSILEGGFGKLAVPLGIAAGGIGLIVSSSKMLQGSLGNVIKSIQHIIRPFGDVFAAALMPVVSILRPIGMFFNILMKPYIQKATAAMRAGEAMLYAGDTSGATGAFALGASYLIKPFADMFTSAIYEMGAGVYTLVGKILEMNPLTHMFGVSMEVLGTKMKESAVKMNEVTTNILDTQLGNVLANAENTTGRSMGNIVKSLNDADITIGYLSSSLTLKMASPFNDLNNWIVNDWGTEFTSQVKKIFSAVQAAQLYTPPATTIKYASSASNITSVNSFIDEQIQTAQNAFLGGWSNVATSTGTELVNNVSNAFSTALGNIATGITTTVTGILTGANSIGGTIFNLLSGQFAHGGTVPETGLYQLHEGETVTTPGASFGQGVSISLNPSYSITTTKSSDEIRRIVEDVSDSKYRELVSRLGG